MAYTQESTGIDNSINVIYTNGVPSLGTWWPEPVKEAGPEIIEAQTEVLPPAEDDQSEGLEK